MKGKVALSEWHDVALNGRRVVLAFDSDVTVKKAVAQALRELAGYLTTKGAKVEYLHLPHDDGKAGLDDHIAVGATVEELLALVRADVPVSPGATAGSAGSATSAGSPERDGDTLVEVGDVLGDMHEWLSRFVCTVDDTDLDLLTLWAAHTHLCLETYTTPRLILDSPVPGSGKTTVLEHLERLCLNPVQMASLSSPALLTRMLDAGLRTILIDEADRSLNPDRDGVAELLAVLNSGYKRGGSRPVLVPTKDSGWQAKEMPTFAPVAMAGNNPNLPDDTRSRSIRVLLMPDIDGTAEESDWEVCDEPARLLHRRLAAWAQGVRDDVRANRPELPDGVRGRARERWAPLKRVAIAAGGPWPAVVDELAVRDVQRIEAEREDGIVRERPSVVVLRHIHEVWADGETFVPTETLITRLVWHRPDMWGAESPFGKPLTPQRLGRMLVTAYNVHSDRPDAQGPRGYLRTSLGSAFSRSGLEPSTVSRATPHLPEEPANPAEPAEPAQTTDPNLCGLCGVERVTPSARALEQGWPTICRRCDTASQLTERSA